MTNTARPKVRYAVVGLGWFAQTAILPAFANATDNSELVALVSGDPDNLTEAVEIWTFLRRNGGEWRVSAIQGVADA